MSLDTEGFEVVTALSGLDGLLLTLDENPDAIVLDLPLSDLSGQELCRRLHQDALLNQVAIVALTPMPARAERLEVITTGADASMTHPVSFAALISQLRHLIGLSKHG